MNLYRSSSFFGSSSHFGADHHYIDLTGPEFNPVPPPIFVEIEDDEVPPPPAPPAPPANGFPTIHTFFDTTVAQDPVSFDETPIRTHIQEDPDNITLLWKTGGNGYAAINSKKSYFFQNGDNAFNVYECKAGVDPNMYPYQYNLTHVKPKPYINLQRVGVPIGGFLVKPPLLFTGGHQIYLLSKTTKILGAVADYSVVYDQNAGTHCQDGSGGQVYKLKPVNLAIGGAAFGRRLRRRRSSSFGKRTKPRRRRSSSFGRRANKTQTHRR
jgi:hypothetical protein